MPAKDRSQPPENRLHLTIVKDESVLDSVLDDWHRLAAENPNFFVTPHWVLTWWRHYNQGASPRLFVYYDDQGPRALFPMMLVRQKMDGLAANVLGFMTNEESTKAQWIVRGEVAPILNQWAADLASDKEWDVLELVSLPADTPGVDLLPPALASRRVRCLRRSGEGALGLDVTGNFEDYWQARSGKLRKDIRYRENRLRDRGELTLEISRTEDDPQKWLDRIFRVASHTWKTTRLTSLADGKRRLFFADVVKELLPAGQALVFAASLDGVDIAYDLTFVHRGVLYGFKTDYHQDYRDLAPGILLVKNMIEYGFADPRIQTLDFITDTPWMRRWTEQATGGLHLRAFNRTPKGRTLSLLETRLRPVARGIKRTLRRGKPG